MGPMAMDGADAVRIASPHAENHLHGCDPNARKPCMMIVKDSNGTPLSDGASVEVIKDLKVRGT
jgi:uncharacterized Zn ribbon protein